MVLIWLNAASPSAAYKRRMAADRTEWQKPDALRARAQWYRDYATVCSGDNAWCLKLAAHFDRLADEFAKQLQKPGDA
jgi:hypothetical protein